MGLSPGARRLFVPIPAAGQRVEAFTRAHVGRILARPLGFVDDLVTAGELELTQEGRVSADSLHRYLSGARRGPSGLVLTRPRVRKAATEPAAAGTAAVAVSRPPSPRGSPGSPPAPASAAPRPAARRRAASVARRAAVAAAPPARPAVPSQGAAVAVTENPARVAGGSAGGSSSVEITTAQAAERLGVKPGTIRTMLSRGQLKRGDKGILTASVERALVLRGGPGALTGPNARPKTPEAAPVDEGSARTAASPGAEAPEPPASPAGARSGTGRRPAAGKQAMKTDLFAVADAPPTASPAAAPETAPVGAAPRVVAPLGAAGAAATVTGGAAPEGPSSETPAEPAVVLPPDAVVAPEPAAPHESGIVAEAPAGTGSAVASPATTTPAVVVGGGGTAAADLADELGIGDLIGALSSGDLSAREARWALMLGRTLQLTGQLVADKAAQKLTLGGAGSTM